MSEDVAFDPKSLTLDEAERLEELCDGEPVGKIMVALLTGKFSTRHLRAVAVVMKQRQGEQVTMDDLGDLRVSGVVEDLVESGIASHLLEQVDG